MKCLINFAAFVAAVVMVGASVPKVVAQQYSYTTFDIPNAESVLVNGTNDLGDLVGQARFPSSSGAQGFIAPNGGATVFFDPPGSEATAVMDLNENGITVGWSFQDPTFLFVDPYVRDASGAISTPDLTSLIDAEDIEFNSINNDGVIVGGALDYEFVPTFNTTASAFVIDAADPANPLPSEASLIDLAGVENEFAWGVNGMGQIVGSASDNGVTRGFLLEADRTSFELFDIPGSSLTRPQAVNDLGQIVGSFRRDATGSDRFSFLLNPDDTWVELAVPGAESTWARDINNEGTIVGQYSLGGRSFGFVATVIPEPSSLSLLAVAGLLFWPRLGRPRTA